MEVFLEQLTNTLFPILATVITAIAGYVGLNIKKIYEKYVDTETKKEIVNETVKYVEQVCRRLGTCGEDKFKIAKEKATDWLNSKGIKISDAEMEILIESAVNSYNKALNKE